MTTIEAQQHIINLQEMFIEYIQANHSETHNEECRHTIAVLTELMKEEKELS